MGKLNEILDGWGNLIKSNFGLLGEEYRLMAEERILHNKRMEEKKKEWFDMKV